MGKKPLLSICIPTYNRSEYLKICLNSIIHKKGFNDIEIVISDNCSTDNTPEIANSYIKKYSNIKYYKNSKNIGFTLNVLKIIELSNGNYCWLLSDDDCLYEKDNLLINIKNSIVKYKLDQIILNTDEYDNKLKSIIKYNGLEIEKSIFFNKGYLFLEYLTTKKYFSEFLAFMSVRIFKKSIWLENTKLIDLIKNNPENLVFPHIMLLTNDIENQRIFIEKTPYIKFRSNNAICVENNSNRKSIKIIFLLYKYIYTISTNKKFKKYILGGIKKCLIEFILSFFIDLTKKIKIYVFISKLYRKYLNKIN